MASSKKTWISIFIAVFVMACAAVITLVAGSAYWFSRHVSTQFSSPETAAEEFMRARARFGNQTAMIEISGDKDNPRFNRPPDSGQQPRADLQTLHARVFDPHEGKMLRADIPFWLIRFGKRFTLTPDMGSITLRDLEQHGPGLIVNGQSQAGAQILVWID